MQHNIGDTWMMKIHNSNSSEEFRSKVMDIKDDGIYISYPVSNKTKKTSFLFNGTILDINYIDELGRVVQFTSEIIGRSNASLPLLVIKRPEKEKYTVIQRRRFLRIKCMLDVAIHPLKKEFRPFRAVTNDISAGGASVLIENNISLEEGSNINCWIVLPREDVNYQYLKLLARIVRVARHNEKYNVVSLQFVDITNQQEQQLLQFSFEYQLEMRQKEFNFEV